MPPVATPPRVRTHRGLLLALLVTMPALAGCVGGLFGQDAGAIHIAGPRQGDRLLLQTDTRLALLGQSPQRLLMEHTTLVVPGTLHEADRYGRAVQTVQIQTRTEVLVHEPGPGDPSSQGLVQRWNASIETAGGHWLYQRDYTIAMDLSQDDAAGPCAQRIEGPPIPVYTANPVDHRLSRLYGQSLGVGERIIEDARIPTATGQIRLVVTSVGVERGSHTLVLDGQEQTVRALLVDQHFWREDRDDVAGVRYTSDWILRRWYADDIPVPVREEIAVDTASTQFDHRATLVAYDRGQEPIPVGRGAPAARYHGVHPDAAVETVGRWPDLGGLPLEYGFGQAMDRLYQDPRAIQTSQWLAERPDAALLQALYTRDAAAQTYRWIFAFTDGRETAWAAVDQRPGLLGIPVERAVTAGFDAPWDGAPSPAEMAAWQVVDPATGLEVAMAFLATPQWFLFAWGAVPPQEGRPEPEARALYSLGPGGREVRSEDFLERHWLEWAGPLIHVDVDDGAVLDARSAVLACGSEPALDVPLATTAIDPPSRLFRHA